MKDLIFKIVTNKKIAKNTYEMVLMGDTADIKCGQFVNIKLDGFYLRRPISVCCVEGNLLTLIYKVVGKGTEAMAEMEKDTELLVLTGLGNGYNTSLSGEKPLLIGGGAGVPPMYQLCRELVNEGKGVSVILGFNSKDEVFYEDEFKKLGANVIVAGSAVFGGDVLANAKAFTEKLENGVMW